MIEVKTCSLDNGKLHVCFDDLLDYWRKDELFSGLNPIETAEIRKNLGMPTDMTVDSSLDLQSKNPVQNRVITAHLQKKPDTNQLAKIALTGLYSDLRNRPCNLPNPASLLVTGLNSEGEASLWRYDGEELVCIDLNTKLSLFENDSHYIDINALNTAITLKGIIVNGEILTADCDKFVTIDIPTKLSDLVQDIDYVQAATLNLYAPKTYLNNYLTKTEGNRRYVGKDTLDSDITNSSLSTNAPSSLAVYNYCLSLVARIEALERRLQ